MCQVPLAKCCARQLPRQFGEVGDRTCTLRAIDRAHLRRWHTVAKNPPLNKREKAPCSDSAGMRSNTGRAYESTLLAGYC